MDNPVNHPLEEILRQCAQAQPNPWYPSTFARTAGIPRDSLDPYLEQLRLGGLIRLTDWMPGTGQGYVLTPTGAEVLQSPRLLDRLRTGQVPAAQDGPVRRDLRRMQGTRWERGEAARDALLGPPSLPWVTFVLIFLNVLFFLVGLGMASARHVPAKDYLNGGDPTGEVHRIQVQIGFLNGPDVYVHGQWWRLFTACFNHIGLIHLAVNMFSLFAVGPLLERMWGSWRYLLLYLLSGLGGSCGMLIENPIGGGAGASGALWGILASMVTWFFLHRKVLPPSLIQDWRRRLLMVFLLNVGITIWVPGISKGGHFGGGLVGLVAGVPLDFLRFGSLRQRLFALAGLVTISLVCLATLVTSLNRSGEQIERSDLLTHYLPIASEAFSFYNDLAVPFVHRPRGDRDAREEERILEGLAKRKVALANLRASLQQAGPYRSPGVEKQRQRLLTEINELLEHYDRAETILRQDHDTRTL